MATFTRFIVAWLLLVNLVIGANAQKTDLNVAIFAYLPEASTDIENLEKEFEKRHPSIDLDLELWDPYADKFEEDGVAQIVDFDLVEIDTCRIDQFMNGAFGGIDELPAEARQDPDDYVGPARVIAKTDIGKYVTPHWVCGNYLQIWASNTPAVNATTFDSFLKAVDPANKPVLAAMWGSTTLGEFYADAVLDLKGPANARSHLIALSKGQTDLDEQAKNAVLSLIKELSTENQENLEYFYNHSYYFPRLFAGAKNSVLLGYSERLYYTERELQLTQLKPIKYPPMLKPDEIVIRQFSFGDKSQGTPSWTDGFVIPKGKLAKKRAAIVAFLLFIQSADAYAVFAEPAQYFAPSYLLPATAISYDKDSALVKKQPLLPQFLNSMSDTFPVSNSEIWQGIKTAGGKLKKIIKP